MKSIELKRNLSKKSGKIKSKQKRIETKLKQNEIKKKLQKTMKLILNVTIQI